ncbi:hypothetical protein IRZ70_20145 [Pseudomonas monteilii]|nr:hypothetical protein [Pseudomonas monteilii]
MKRRDFLISTGLIAAFSSVPFVRRLLPPRPLIIPDAYSLWYNRPAAVDICGGFCFGYITARGCLVVVEVTDDLLVRRSNVIYRYDSSSDHGSPALVKIPEGKHKGKILACFSKHASPLMTMRTSGPGDIGVWEAPSVLDSGRSTYASVAALPGGRIVLMHTIQERIGNSDAGEWRRTVVRWTEDGGDSWSDPVQIVGLGAGTFPYSTPLASSSGGRCAMAYAIYRSATKRHQGLYIVITSDSFRSWVEIPIELGEGSAQDTIPYETKWLGNGMVAVSFSQMMDSTRSVNKVAFVNVESQTVSSIVTLSDSAVHSYAGGASIDSRGEFVISSPPGGGLVKRDISLGSTKILIEKGSFSSPWIFMSNGRSMLAALKNPSIESTRRFSADLYIAQLG